MLLGFGVPTVTASPFSRGNPKGPRVKHSVFDHTSILKLIEWRWDLQPLTARDASNDVGNLATALDFSNPNPMVPSLPSRPRLHTLACRCSRRSALWAPCPGLPG